MSPRRFTLLADVCDETDGTLRLREIDLLASRFVRVGNSAVTNRLRLSSALSQPKDSKVIALGNLSLAVAPDEQTAMCEYRQFQPDGISSATIFLDTSTSIALIKATTYVGGERI